jgi:hypothetical protein
MNDTTNDSVNDPAFRVWLDQAWNDHPEAPQRIAAELAAHTATWPDSADGAEAVRLAEHVMLAHLADPPALQQLLARLPADAAALAPSMQRAQWALATLADETPPSLPDAPRWRALHSVVMVLVSRGQVAQARARLLAEEAAAAAHVDTDARKAYAATANNTASDLHSGPRGDAERDALMLEAAELSRRAWQRAGGTWMNTERADYLLALCHATLGHGAEAVAAAGACLALCEAHGADAAELFFAHECNVHAERAAGNAARALHHRERMVALLADIGDAGMHGYCKKTLAKT